MEFLRKNKREILLVLLIVLMCVASFGLGRLSAVSSNKKQVRIMAPAGQEIDTKSVVASSGAALENYGNVVASKQGSKYHLPWCPGAKAIKDENKVYFSTREEAEARGYTPAANCKGL